MALLEHANPLGRVSEREPARIGVGLGVQRHFAHGIQFGRERGPRLDFAFEVRVGDIPRQRQLHQFLFEGLDARICVEKVGGADLGSMPDRRGHALGLGQRASGIGRRFFKLRQASLEFELALGLRGPVLLARPIQFGLRLLARRSQDSRAAASSALARAEADARIGLLGRGLAQPLQNRGECADRSGREPACVRERRAGCRPGREARPVPGGRYAAFGGDGIHRLGLGFQRALRTSS